MARNSSTDMSEKPAAILHSSPSQAPHIAQVASLKYLLEKSQEEATFLSAESKKKVVEIVPKI
jgi:hypothetical protein